MVGAENLKTDQQALAQFGTDWTRFYTPDPLAIVFPRDVSQVQAVVRLANEQGFALVPSGGRTGLSAGAVATNGEVVISLDKMNQILNFHEVDDTVEVEAGVITQQLQDYAWSKGRYYPVDFASAGSSQIGGNIATNAGGIKVLRYGLTRDWVRGLKVVTGTGALLDLNKGLVKNATGYDLRHLMIGSEGTLGIIVEATIALTDQPVNPEVILLAVPQMTDVISVLQTFKQHIELTAFEFFSHLAMQHVITQQNVAAPFAVATDYYVLLEFEQRSAEVLEQAMAAFEACLENGWISDGIVSQSEQQRLDLWRYREHISESITPHTPYKNDVSVRVSDVPAFLADVESVVSREYPDFEIVWFGHIGDGNLHLNILKPTSWQIEDFKRECEKVSKLVLNIVAGFGGSVSAEHGVGLLKKDQLTFSRSPAEIEFLKAIKQVFDPNGVLNPGKLIN